MTSIPPFMLRNPQALNPATKSGEAAGLQANRFQGATAPGQSSGQATGQTQPGQETEALVRQQMSGVLGPNATQQTNNVASTSAVTSPEASNSVQKTNGFSLKNMMAELFAQQSTQVQPSQAGNQAQNDQAQQDEQRRAGRLNLMA